MKITWFLVIKEKIIQLLGNKEYRRILEDNDNYNTDVQNKLDERIKTFGKKQFDCPER